MSHVFRGIVSRFITLSTLVLSLLLSGDGALHAGENANDFREEPGVEITNVSLGIGGQFKIGKWASADVEVTVSQPVSAHLSVDVSDPDGNMVSYHTETIELSGTGSHKLSCLFRCGRLNSLIHLKINDGSKVLATRQIRISQNLKTDDHRMFMQSVRLIATLGIPAGLLQEEQESNQNSSPAKANRVDEKPLEVVELTHPDQLPKQSTAFDSLDAVIISGSVALDEERNQALRQWVHQGGHLVLSVGNDVETYQQSTLYQWVGEHIPLEGQSRISDFSRLEAYAASKQRLPFASRLKVAKIRTHDLVENNSSGKQVSKPGFSGRVYVTALNGPLLVRVPYGFGRITFLGLDLHRPPVATWKPTKNLIRKILLGERRGLGRQHQSRGRQLKESGITDLASQLHASLENFPLVRRFSIWKVLSYSLLYLLMIGPLDYLLVHRLLKKPQLTWLTFPLIIALAVFLAAGSASDLNGTALRLNQLDIVDLDVESQSVRTRSWLTLYSPESRRYHVSAEPAELGKTDSPSTPSQKSRATVIPKIAWRGIPENTFEGMYREGGFEIGRPNYRLAAGASAIENLPVSIWSTKGLVATWEQQTPRFVESDLTSSGTGQVSGTITHHLNAPLEDWILAYGDRVIRSRDAGALLKLAPGRPLSLANNPGLRTRRLSEFLTSTTATQVKRKRGSQIDILVRQKKYDPMVRDMSQILRMLTFHDSTGGTLYTGLENNTLRNSDLSALLLLDRAVLFARINAPAARYILKTSDSTNLEYQADQSTFVRIILPVKPLQTRAEP